MGHGPVCRVTRSRFPWSEARSGSNFGVLVTCAWGAGAREPAPSCSTGGQGNVLCRHPPQGLPTPRKGDRK